MAFGLTTISPSPSLPLLRLDAPSMAFLRRPRLTLRRLSSISAALRQDTTVWTPAPTRLRHPRRRLPLPRLHRRLRLPRHRLLPHPPRQYLQLRLPDSAKPTFLAIASPPSLAAARGVFEFLVKSIAGSTAELLCGLRGGDVVELTPAMGRGFEVDEISPPEAFPNVIIFATGSGISPIRSLIETGFYADKRSDVRLYYGARNLQRMAYQDRFRDWESSGVRIVPVLSQPDDRWKGEQGYVQAAFSRAKQLSDPSSTGAVLCGQKQMTEEITSILVADGVLREKILKNF
ncbi:fruit protein-like protein [Cinnamomum micranthum f. kanehirae]|uniref:Fruit protein-like protein n=1 Tax=Cinnamomum micranthum f. kanehirae TaxID=337451 RepID=A0A443PSZ3_9MAGN|nr:fruit protein-like protein [Cinnamomum micranthum f. kanehirae]